jgi:Signal transduction histidine kinase
MKPAATHFFLLFCACFSPVLAQQKHLDSLYKMGVEKSSAGEVPAATALLVEATKLAEAENNVKLLCLIQIAMGKLGIISENNEASAKAIQLAESYCSACKDTLALARINLQKGILRAKDKQFEEALEAFDKGAKYYLIVSDSVGAYGAMAKIGNVYEMQGKYKEAQPSYLQFYGFAKNKPKTMHYLTANIYLAGNYMYLDDYGKARAHNDEVLRLAKELGLKFEYAQALRYDAMIHKGLGRFSEAYDKLFHYTQYFHDTLMNAEHLRQSEELKAKYETEKKEAQIALQQAELDREKLRSWVLLGGLAATLIVGGFLFALARKLRKRNEEKEFLLKEIHHRVKNNLQILSSLLRLQSRQITDDAALDAVREGQSRVDAMGLMHQKLYMGDNVAKVEMKDYLEQFGQNMLDSFGIEDGRVQIRLELEPLQLDVDTAIPLGLIINELVTNSLKYAFPNERPGTVVIALWKNDKNQLTLRVTDDGVGQTNANQDKQSTSFGTKLVQMLSKKLKGTPTVLPQDRGYATEIVFEKWA